MPEYAVNTDNMRDPSEHKNRNNSRAISGMESIRREFDHIVGYELLKEELIQICDSMKNKDIYEKLGATAPHGLLLHGVPGVGKTTMAEAMARACGRPIFRLRKNSGNMKFIEEIRRVFSQAEESAPSFLLLDDIDKFADGCSMYGTAPEYAVLQTCIDEIGDKDVFIAATANNLYKLPESLLRCGRFDRKRRISPPDIEDTVRILEKYLKDSKKLADDVNMEELAKIACGYSCSYIESLANDAAVLAGYERSKEITMDHFIRAFLKWRVPCRFTDLQPEEKRRVAVYEAGRAVALDTIAPEALTLAVSGVYDGYMDRNLDELPLAEERERSRISTMRAMAGRAAVELIYGDHDEYTSRNLAPAFRYLEYSIKSGEDDFFCMIQPMNQDITSADAQEKIEDAIVDMAERYYADTMTILRDNREYLQRVTEALIEKDYLLASEIRRLRPEYVN